MDMLSKAVELAGRFHAGQKDKAGKPYILHVLAVMLNAKRLCAFVPGIDEIIVMTVAVLHDVIEDTALTAEMLVGEFEFPGEVVACVQVLSKQYGEEYTAFVKRCATHSAITRIVKMADIEHNIDAMRLNPDDIEPGDLNRIAKYRKAYAVLKQAQLDRMDAWDD